MTDEELVRELVEALRYYADERVYTTHEDTSFLTPPVVIDAGTRALKALLVYETHTT